MLSVTKIICGTQGFKPTDSKSWAQNDFMTCFLDRFIEVLFIATKLILLRMKFHDF